MRKLVLVLAFLLLAISSVYAAIQGATLYSATMYGGDVVSPSYFVMQDGTSYFVQQDGTSKFQMN